MANEQQYKAAGVKCLSEEAKLEQYPVISEHTDIFKSLVTNVLSQFQSETRGGGALVAAEMHTHKGVGISVPEQGDEANINQGSEQNLTGRIGWCGT